MGIETIPRTSLAFLYSKGMKTKKQPLVLFPNAIGLINQIKIKSVVWLAMKDYYIAPAVGCYTTLNKLYISF